MALIAPSVVLSLLFDKVGVQVLYWLPTCAHACLLGGVLLLCVKWWTIGDDGEVRGASYFFAFHGVATMLGQEKSLGVGGMKCPL